MTRSRGRLARRLAWVNRLLALLVVLVLAATCWVAFQKITEPDDDAGDTPSGTSPSEPSYSDLKVFDEAGHFGGSIAIQNPLSRDAEILVEVDNLQRRPERR